MQGPGKRNKSVVGAIRQPSGGPTYDHQWLRRCRWVGAQRIPLSPFFWGLTGDINAIMNTHYLAMAVPSQNQYMLILLTFIMIPVKLGSLVKMLNNFLKEVLIR